MEIIHSFKHYILLLPLWHFVYFATAQSPQKNDFSIQEKFSRYQHYTMENGLSNNTVTCIAQDEDGFLWFGTEEGLNRFDGERFEQFFYRPGAGGIPSDRLNKLLCLPGHRLLVGTNKGLCVVDTRFLTFKTVALPARPGMEEADLHVLSLLLDKKGQIWVGTRSSAHVFDGQLRLVSSYFAQTEDGKPYINYFGRTLLALPEGVVVKHTPKKDWRDLSPWKIIDFQQQILVPLAAVFPHYGVLDTARFAISVTSDTSGNVWFTSLYATSETALYCLDGKTHTTTALLKRPPHSYPDNRVDGHFYMPVLLPDSLLLLQRYFGKPAVFDLRNHSLTDLNDWESSLPDGSFIHSYVDRDGNLWLCPNSKGIYFFTLKPSPVTAMTALNETHEKVMKQAGVSGAWFGFQGFQQQDRWVISSDKGGLYSMDKANRGVKGAILSNLFHPYAYVINAVQDREDTLWLYTSYNMFWYNPSNNTVGLLREIFPELDSLAGGFLFRDSFGLIWANAKSGGVCSFDTRTRRLNHYPTQGAHAPYPLPNASDVVEDPLTHDLWFCILSKEKYLVKWSRETGVFQKIELVNRTGLPLYTPGYSFMADRQGNLWMQAADQMFFVNTKTLEVTTFGKHEGLNTNDPNGFCLDKTGNLWFATDYGLSRYDPNLKTIRTFYQSDGLLSNTIVNVELLDTANNVLLVSTTKGLCLFEPDKILPAPNITHITSLWASDSTYTLPESGVWTLPFSKNDLRIAFTSINFLNGARNTYQYSLEAKGEAEVWKDNGMENTVSFLNLAPGNYTFRVRSANSDGLWGKQDASLNIVVRPPWWQTRWAYLLYAALIGGGFFAFYRFQLRRRLEHAESLRLQELDAVKTRLYTNITHEFRTPLTVILGMAQQVLDKPKEHFHDGLKMIIRNGQNLLHLVNEMLDLSKLESGKLSLHYQQGDVINFLKYLMESFHSLAEGKGVQIHFLTDLKEYVMDFDAERLRQVVANLLSNAIKFTPAGGHVYFVVKNEIIDAGTARLEFSIRDTGIGISEAQLPYVFDRFFQASPQHWGEAGSGIGLALTKELVKLMEGEITVKSTPGAGTTFTVTLPVRQIAELQQPVVHSKIPLQTELRETEHQPLPSFLPEGGVPNGDTAAEKPYLLLAEDNADVVTYLRSCLAADYRLAVAKDGQEAIEMALETIPDLLVTDVMMPHKDGFEVCEQLKNDERTSHIPIVMLTAKADMDNKLEGLKRGADAYLMKPFHREELLLRIQKLLELRQKLQQYYCTLAGGTATPTTANDALPMGALEDYFIKKVKKSVDAHLDDSEFSVEILCMEVGISHAQLHRKLTALTGMSANKFIRYVRLNKAKELLAKPELSIISVAMDTGFNDPSYFGKVFKQEFGMTPMEWRERNYLV